MAIMTFNLEYGLKVGDIAHFEVGFRELTTGDYIDAQLAAEKVIVNDGKALAYTSDVLFGAELLARQIEYIGDIQGPISLKELRKLHPDDFQSIQEKGRELDELLMQELEERGRP
ncbi:hypothetical protein I6Z03_002977 [Vibrio parahaemolyticus]|nr:hypothetical protein [Vibrio parahaemolyticus]